MGIGRTGTRRGQQRSSIGRRVGTAAAAVVIGVALTGCGDDDGGSTDVTTSAPVASTATSTTTATTTTSPPTTIDEPTTTEASSTTGDTPGSDVDADEEAGAPDTDIWELNATSYRSQPGLRVAYGCTPEGTLDSVWGTDTYTDDSGVCSAGVHAGIITVEDGGRVVIEVTAGESQYEGSVANGVTSLDYPAWGGSFILPDQ